MFNISPTVFSEDPGKVIDVPVVDHLIVSHKGYTSMRKNYLCEFEVCA